MSCTQKDSHQAHGDKGGGSRPSISATLANMKEKEGRVRPRATRETRNTGP